MSLFAILFSCHLAAAGVPNEGVSVLVDVSYLQIPATEGILSYGRTSSQREQVMLHDVHLQIGTTTFYPSIHVAAYLDEISGTAICRRFGFGRGVLGTGMARTDVNVFSMSSSGLVEELEAYGSGGPANRSTSQVLCQY